MELLRTNFVFSVCLGMEFGRVEARPMEFARQEERWGEREQQARYNHQFLAHNDGAFF